MSMNSGNYNPPRTAKEMAPVIAAAVGCGITLFDTAEVYGPFINEELVGKTIRPYRDRVAIATKFGWDMDYATGRRTGKQNSRPEHIRRVVDMSLKRLQTDRIDLLYQHRVDPEVPIEDVAANRPLIDFLLEWSAQKNATPAQLSLAWLLAKKPFVIPIPGITRIPHLEEDLGAFNVSFSAEEFTEFDRALNGIKLHGERLNPRLMALSEVEAAVKE